MRMIGMPLTLLVAAVLAGCQQLPGSREEQATGAGAATGAAAGAVLADDGNELLGALLGGAMGAGGGYLIGARTDWFEGDSDEASAEAEKAVREAQENPATAEEARNASTADIDQNGFVTTDELVAMEDAGLSDDEILDRLEASDAVFDLTSEQADRLVDEGLSRNVVSQLEDINREDRQEVLGQAR
jgi:hypothetical protein